MLDVIKEILIPEKELLKLIIKITKSFDLPRKKANRFWCWHVFIEINHTITGSNNITLRKVYVMPHGFDNMFMDQELIEDKLYQIIDQFNERKITSWILFFITLKQNTYIFWWK